MRELSLAEVEALVDRAGVAGELEALMPCGGRPRQLPVRTLLIGVLAAMGDGRPAHLTRVHRALVSLPAADRRRLGVQVRTRRGTHLLTYRQVERTFSSVMAALDPTPSPSLGRLGPDERPAAVAARRAGIDAAGIEHRLTALVDALVEASVPDQHKASSSSVAVDWTDHATWSRPEESGRLAADADATWGHRRPNRPGASHESFFGYYAQAVTMVPDEGGSPVPELVRRVALWPCAVDPPTALVPTLATMAADGIPVGDVLADCGYSHRVPERWAAPLRRIGAQLVQDMHPSDRGTKGTHQGAVACNGRLYCPATPPSLLDLAPLPLGAGRDQTEAHDARAAELARYKLAAHAGPDDDGYIRLACPAAAAKLRCPLKPASMALSFDRPEILSPPEEPPACCAQATITVGPSVNAKTNQKHDFPSRAHRLSYARRTGAERSFSTLKDTASTDVRRGWCRLFGRARNLVMLACAVVVRNLRVLASFERRMAAAAAAGAPKRRRRRRDLSA